MYLYYLFMMKSYKSTQKNTKKNFKNEQKLDYYALSPTDTVLYQR